MSYDKSRSAWISRGFEQLVATAAAGTTPAYGVVIVGSGYGGAVAADVFARCKAGGQPVSVCVLERGKEYLPGAFPRGFRELPAHIRMDGNKEGLFDIRGGPDVNTIVANGLGGGSLINAGVMEEPSAGTFASGWPVQLTAAVLKPYYDRASALLGAFRNGARNDIELLPAAEIPAKYKAIRSLGDTSFRPAAITVAMADVPSSGNVQLKKCVRCGDCATGCNFGAKDSLDVNLLFRAFDNGAEIITGATVLDIGRDTAANEWLIHAVYTDSKLRKRQGGRTVIRAKHVVLAAGALGSTEILLRSQSSSLSFSARLGQRCSTNGDMLVTDYDTQSTVNTVADEALAPSSRSVGPTITGIVDLRTSAGVLIEEISVPAGLRRAFTEIFGTVNALHMLDVKDGEKHARGHPADDIYEVGAQRIDRSALYAVMGDDGASGAIDLVIDGDSVTAAGLTDDDDGVGRIAWQDVQHIPLFDHQIEQVANLTETSGGRILPNPVWKLLPANMTWLLDGERGPVTTVHPLGGCAMADSAAGGVVDHIGRVFDPSGAPGAVHDGLVVLDGSIVPTALGTNPALTIAAVSLRAAELLGADWGFTAVAPGAPGAPEPRPVFRNTDSAFTPTPTKVEIFERLAGPVKFKDGGGERKTRIVELTLRFDEHALGALTRPHENGTAATLTVNGAADDPPTMSRVRVYEEKAWTELNRRHIPAQRLERELDDIAIFNAPVTGTLAVFLRDESRALGRILRAVWAYLLNRGLRDTAQAGDDGGPGALARIKSGRALASRSGEIRLLEYTLDVGAATKSTITLSGNRIVGRKRFTYLRKCNPWRQLMEVGLDEFPGLKNSEDLRVLKLDPVHLTRIGVPLFRLTRQEDAATAIADLIAFFGYFIRLLVGLHIWSFRQPDAETPPKVINLFPSKAGSMPTPQIIPIDLGAEVPAGGSDPVPGELRLTRFVGTDPGKHPVLLIPGYSTSGTVFSHHAIYPNFASRLWDTGRDVWILDMRTSSAFPTTATKPWSFEQIACRDLPVALHRVYAMTGKQVDVHAHCMGAAMLSMALLHSDEMTSPVPGFPQVDPAQMQQWIRRVSFSQVGPLVVMSPANVFRSYALRYFLEYVPDDYQFRPENPTLADDLLDRILYTLPYPEEEFTITNPIAPWKRAEWTRTRHRMDALYGRSFNLVNVGDGVLDHIDDQFGPMSIKTVTQAIHFARYSVITNVRGRNTFVSRETLAERWQTEPTSGPAAELETQSINTPDNGLADVRTLDRIETVMLDAGLPYRPKLVGAADRAGHQDALIGKPRGETFTAVLDFLENGLPPNNGAPSTEQVAYPPWIGPIVTDEVVPSIDQIPRTTIRIGTRPTHRKPECVVMLPIDVDNNGRLTRPNGVPFADDAASETYIVDHLVTYTSPALQDDHWDAFQRPDFPKLPGYADDVVVLVIYNETEQLGGQGIAYFAINASDPLRPVLQPIDPVRWRLATRVPPVVLPDPEFPRRLIETVLGELVRQWPATGKPPSGGDPASPPPPARILSAGVGLTPTQAAVLDRLRDEDYDLTDGVISHRAPTQPKSSPAAAGTAFAFASCQYPRGFIDEPIAYEAYAHALERLDGASWQPAPVFALFCGDQVYVDPTAGLFDPSASDDRYETPYHMWLRNHRVRDVLRLLPSFMLLDDHEIDDNWEPIAPAPAAQAASNQKTRNDGVLAFRKYQHGMTAPVPGNSQSYPFVIEGIRFFMLDTRSQRARRTAGNVGTATLFDDPTLATLKSWLAKDPTLPKLVVSPSMLLPRHRRAAQWNAAASAIRSDGWDGYPATLHALLAHIVDDPNVRHVVFLSGDEHSGAVATIDILNQTKAVSKRIHSIHTPGAYTPFPFANGTEHALLGDDAFDFKIAGQSYRCTVSTAFPATRNRFTYLNLREAGGSWLLDYQFGDGPVSSLSI